jgi:HNH endonuclease
VAASTGDVSTHVLEKIEVRLKNIEEGQATLALVLARVSSVDPWEILSTSSTLSQKSRLRNTLTALYAHDGIKCIVSGVKDDASKMQHERVVTAHLWPRSRAAEFQLWKSGRNNGEICMGIDDAQNGLFFLNDIEKAYDKKRVCFLCDPFKCELVFTVLDPSLLRDNEFGAKPCPSGCTRTYFELDSTRITSPVIDMDRRPSFQILSFHASWAVESALRKRWISKEKHCELANSIKILSPVKNRQS